MNPHTFPPKLVHAPVVCAFAVCAFVVLASPACKKATEPGAVPGAAVPGAAAPGAAAPASAEPSDADRAEGAKLSAAIECLNGNSGRAFEVRDSYLHDVDPVTGSSHGKKPPLLGLGGTIPCFREVKEAGALTPAVPDLDKASAAYVTALDALVKAWEALTAYYEKGDYLDDGGKKTATLHPQVMDAFKTFASAHRELSTIVHKRNRERREAKLAAREKAQGRNFEVIVDSMMLEAETLVPMSSSPGADPTALDAQIAAYGKLVDEVDAYATAHPDEASKRGSLANLRSYDKTFLSASKVVARKLRGKDHPTGDEFHEVNRQYNSLVDNYNNH